MEIEPGANMDDVWRGMDRLFKLQATSGLAFSLIFIGRFAKLEGQPPPVA
jgi:hypothetical protein